MSIVVRTLGSGSEVGRSCFLVSIEDTSVLIDAGVHLSPSSVGERVPVLPPDVSVSGVFISHYHMDHVGALPYLTQLARSISDETDIFMTSPTKSLSPLVCVDYSRGPNGDLYVPNHVHRCFDAVGIKTIGCGEELSLSRNREFRIRVVYAGHVIGGVMLFFSYRGITLVYTGDFSVCKSDSLLHPIRVPAQFIPREGVDVVISEATRTYADPQRRISPETEVCNHIRKALLRGGRVLIPIFAVGRTQEFAIMIRNHLGSDVSLFTTSPAGQRASVLTASFHRQWIREECVPSDLNVRVLCETDIFPPNSIVFASPAMLEGGSSLRLFSGICGDSKSLVLFTGSCNKGTVGNRLCLFASRRWMKEKVVNIGNQDKEVKCECVLIPFTNHTDGNGIVSTLRQLRPRRALMLVHGQRQRMEEFKELIRKEKVIDPESEIVIPFNKETSVFNLTQGTNVTSGDLSGRRVVRIRRCCMLRKPFPLVELRELISSGFPQCSLTENQDSGYDCVDKRAEATIYHSDYKIVFEWWGDEGFGPEWISINPLVNGLMHILASSGICLSGSRGGESTQPIIREDEYASLSECSI
jgi:integrator complex subunit 11